MRYERKYRVEDLDLHTVLAAVRSHRVSFRSLFPDRQVNNIYLDTPTMSFFRENLAGIAQRKKYRIRWYGQDIRNVTDPILEVKIKDTELGEKVSTKLPGFEISNFSQVSKALDERLIPLLMPRKSQDTPNHLSIVTKEPSDTPDPEKAPYPIEPLRPSLINTYLRSYFISYDGKFRLTIDREMRFYSLDHTYRPYRNYIEDNAVVIEVKYEEEDDKMFDRIGQYLPFRLTKNSKYVNGILLTGNA